MKIYRPPTSRLERILARAAQWLFDTALVLCVSALVVWIVLLAVSAAAGQCYIDPATGQRVCPSGPAWINGQYQWAAPANHGAVPAAPPRASSVASPPAPRWNDPRIYYCDGGVATGISIDGDASYLLSCAHGLAGVGDLVEVANRYGARRTARVVAIDQTADCAILQTDVQLAPAAVATSEPPLGAAIRFAGFHLGGPLRVQSGTITNYDDPRIAEASGTPRPGDSGGPITNTAGEIVGVLSGHDGGPVYYARLGPIRRLIDQVRGRHCRWQQTGGGSHGGRPQAAPPTYAQAAPAAAACDCGPRWAAFAQWQQDVSARLAALEQARPESPDVQQLAQQVAAVLPPFEIRVLDPRGPSYSTEFQPVHLGDRVTLPFGPAH